MFRFTGLMKTSRPPQVVVSPVGELFGEQAFGTLLGVTSRFSWRLTAPDKPKQGGTMNSTRNPGRVAGIWYLLLTLIGPLRLMYIPNKLFVAGNASATVDNIAAHEWLFRFGILGDLACGVILIFLVLAFYKLFKGVGQNLAVLVVIFGGVMPAVIDFVSVVNDAAALMVVRGVDFLSVFDKPQQDAIAMLFLRLRANQNTAAEILWGVWLLPLAVLVYRSRFLPRFLGVWLTINGLAYVILSFTGILLPQYQGGVFSLSTPALLGEVALMLWLVIKGAKPPALYPASSPAD
jgi:hypothetical protein